jgi:hypothetical protein
LKNGLVSGKIGAVDVLAECSSLTGELLKSRLDLLSRFGTHNTPAVLQLLTDSSDPDVVLRCLLNVAGCAPEDSKLVFESIVELFRQQPSLRRSCFLACSEMPSHGILQAEVFRFVTSTGALDYDVMVCFFLFLSCIYLPKGRCVCGHSSMCI